MGPPVWRPVSAPLAVNSSTTDYIIALQRNLISKKNIFYLKSLPKCNIIHWYTLLLSIFLHLLNTWTALLLKVWAKKQTSLDRYWQCSKTVKWAAYLGLQKFELLDFRLYHLCLPLLCTSPVCLCVRFIVWIQSFYQAVSVYVRITLCSLTFSLSPSPSLLPR